jgi:hypothetical protein
MSCHKNAEQDHKTQAAVSFDNMVELNYLRKIVTNKLLFLRELRTEEVPVILLPLS